MSETRFFRMTTWMAMTAISAVTLVSSPTLAQQASPSGMTRVQKAYPTGSATTSILMLERMTPTEVRVGESFTYEIHARNLTGSALENLVITETLPTGFTVASIEPQPDNQAGGKASWNVASIAARGSKVMRITGTAAALGEISSCTDVTFSTRICQPTRIVEPALKLVKTAPDRVIQCDPIPLTFTVTNTGSGLARDVVVSDQLPDGWATTTGQRTLSFNAGTLQAGQSREFSATVKSDRTGSFTNTATAKEAGGLTASASTQTTVAKPVLELTKTGPDMRYLNRPGSFQITVRNTGDAEARDTVLVDSIPSGVRFVKASDGGQMSGGRVTWRLGTLAPGASKSVSVDLMMSSKGQMSNTATATAYCADAKATMMTLVKGVPAILLEVIDKADPIEVGSQEVYEITVTNQGTEKDTNIGIQVELPKEQDFVSAKGPVDYKVDGRTIRFAPFPALDPKAKITYQVVVKGTATGDVRFKTTMTSDVLKTPVFETESTHIYE